MIWLTLTCRDEVVGLDLQEESTEYSELLSTLNQVLFLSPNTNNTNYQEFLQTSRLVPSFYDRKPYFGLISPDANSEPESEAVSYQLMARQVFTSRIREEAARLKVNHRRRYLSSLLSLYLYHQCRLLARS